MPIVDSDSDGEAAEMSTHVPASDELIEKVLQVTTVADIGQSAAVSQGIYMNNTCTSTIWMYVASDSGTMILRHRESYLNQSIYDHRCCCIR